MYLKVAEAVLFVRICGRSLIPRLHKLHVDWGRDYRGRGYTEIGYEFSAQVVVVTPTPLGSYPDDEIRSGSMGKVFYDASSCM